jgi:Integrase core domain
VKEQVQVEVEVIRKVTVAGKWVFYEHIKKPATPAKPVALLLADIGVTKTHSRPHVSDDNPFSESQFRTLKYRPEFPDRFGCIQDSRAFCQGFFRWYNNEHRHSGVGLLTRRRFTMAKRKTSCGNARMCSMLLINFTRSASYEALPNHRLFPARSGLTSRFPLRNRCLCRRRQINSNEGIAAEEKAKSSLEAISCQQRSSLEKRNMLEEGEEWGCCGSTELAIVDARRSWSEIPS